MEEKLKAALVVLGFVESATVEKKPKLKVITKMYHKLAMLHHPDRNPGCDEAIFKEITEAYRLVGNFIEENRNKENHNELYKYKVTLNSMNILKYHGSK